MVRYRGFYIVAALVVILALGVGLIGMSLPHRSFPVTSGEIQLAGLQAPVEILRDSYGIPHIYASSIHDLFYAQGYVQAQDRFFQMDFWRHIGAGRLAEMFGESQVDTDIFLRTMGWARVAEQELAVLDTQSLEILNSFAEGVNAYLAGRGESEVSLEYAVLGLTNSGYEIQPWAPIDTLTWAKVMAYDLGGGMEAELERARLLKTLSPDQLGELYPPYPWDHPTIVPPGGPVTANPLPLASPASAALAKTMPTLTRLSQQASGLNALIGAGMPGLGSNSWAISGARTSTGKPLLANDPHLGEQMPSIWYEIGLHCTPVGNPCPYNVAGFAFASAPGVIIGHNDRIAWGFTNVGPDVQDLYIEKINPENPDQYEVNGAWADFRVVRETIRVAGGEPVELAVRYSRHGPVFYYEEEEQGEFRDQAGIELPERYGLALRWPALEATQLFQAIWKFNRAQNWEEFRDGARNFAVPAQNLLYADVDGNIGYQMPGHIPIRKAGDGLLPVPGWTGEYEWTGYIPFEELPSTFNPAQGYIVTANNAVVGPDYSYFLAYDWDHGYRAQRIVDLIENAPGPIDLAYMQKMQGDNYDMNAPLVVQLLQATPLQDERLEQARRVLDGWDFQTHMDSAPAALYEVFWKNLFNALVGDELPAELQPYGDSSAWEMLRLIARQESSPWWDDRTTPQVEGRDQIVRQAFAAALSELEQRQGADPARWNWGDLHQTIFHNQTLGVSGISLIENLFNRGPFRTSGGASIVNATGWSTRLVDEEGEPVENPYQVRSVPSMRMIVDLSNLENSLTVHTTGQSGHAYHPHYADLADLWRNIQYHPMLWDREQLDAIGPEVLRLAP